MENCSSANLSMADWGHVTKLAGNQNKQKKVLYTTRTYCYRSYRNQ